MLKILNFIDSMMGRRLFNKFYIKILQVTILHFTNIWLSHQYHRGYHIEKESRSWKEVEVEEEEAARLTGIGLHWDLSCVIQICHYMLDPIYAC